jgi:hypothetical protein
MCGGPISLLGIPPKCLQRIFMNFRFVAACILNDFLNKTPTRCTIDLKS